MKNFKTFLAVAYVAGLALCSYWIGVRHGHAAGYDSGWIAGAARGRVTANVTEYNAGYDAARAACK